MNDLSQILSEIEHGDPAAADQLLPLVYDELLKLAAARLAQEKPGHSGSGSSASANAAVPEPSSLAIGMCGMVVAAAVRFRKVCDARR